MEGPASLAGVTIKTNGAMKTIPLSAILSIHTGRPASADESGRIDAGIKAIQAYTNEISGSEARRNRDAAVEELTSIGLPVMTPLLQAYKDTDQHEPRPLYRLFERVIPSEADQLDRQASLIRLASGEVLRGEIQSMPLKIGASMFDWGRVRRLAVRRATVTRNGSSLSIDFGNGVVFSGTLVANSVDLRYEHQHPFSDGCQWRASETLEGTLDPASCNFSLRYDYVETPISTGPCAAPCSAQADVTLELKPVIL